MYFVDGSVTKDIIVHTPTELCEFIYKKVNRKPFTNILDVGAYDGALSKPWKKKKSSYIIGLDVIDAYSEQFNEFIHKDYLTTTADNYSVKPDLIISNPPFNDLMSWQYIQHTIKLFGSLIPIIMIVPNYLLDNSKNRAGELEKLNITKIIKLDRQTFNGAAIHCSVVFINMHFSKPKLYEYYYPKREIKGKVRTLYFTKEQEEFLQNELKVKNFTQLVKNLLAKQYEAFPIK